MSACLPCVMHSDQFNTWISGWVGIQKLQLWQLLHSSVPNTLVSSKIEGNQNDAETTTNINFVLCATIFWVIWTMASFDIFISWLLLKVPPCQYVFIDFWFIRPIQWVHLAFFSSNRTLKALDQIHKRAGINKPKWNKVRAMGKSGNFSSKLINVPLFGTIEYS